MTLGLSELASAISAPRNRLISTTDLDEWDAFTRKTLQTPYQFWTAKGHRLDGQIHHIECGSFSLGRRGFGAETYARSAPTEDDGFTVVLPFSGLCEAELGPHSVCLSPQLGSVGSSRHAAWSHCSEDFDHAFMHIGRAQIERTCAGLLGCDLSRPLDFAIGLPTTTPAFRRLAQAMIMAASQADLPVRFPLLTANLEQLVMGTLLLAQPSNYSDALADPAAWVPPSSVRRALDYMEAHLDEPLTMTDVAGHAGIGLRSLQATFRAHFGISPSFWLRNRRLDRAHAALAEAQPGSTSVTRVALDWGFGHLGEFAALYRRRFGTNPSVTLAKRC